jgi:Flp pilus assembly pilin Flp
MHAKFSYSNRLAGKLGPIGWVRETDGSTGVEYAIVLALISVAMLVSVQAVGTGAKSLLQSVSSGLEAVNSGSVAASGLGKTAEEAPGMFN